VEVFLDDKKIGYLEYDEKICVNDMLRMPSRVCKVVEIQKMNSGNQYRITVKAMEVKKAKIKRGHTNENL
jgi:hypothetical protein